MSSLPENIGRIHQNTFIVTISVLGGITLLSVIARLYIRVVVQRQFGLDDAFIIFGFLCLIASVVVIMEKIRVVYIVEAFLINLPGFIPPYNVIAIAFDGRKVSSVAGMLAWVSILSVKFSFLVLFRRLIDRVQSIIQYYWWVVLLFNLATLGFGCATFILGCPFFDDLRALRCTSGTYEAKLLQYADAAMAMDVIGDVLIIVIPINLIWRIRIHWTQKSALAGSLCLTAILIVLTVIRVAGLLTNTGTVDAVWEIFWIIVSAELGLILTAATAFRTLFIARSNSRSDRRSSHRSQTSWFVRQFKFIRTRGTARTTSSGSRSRSHQTPVKNISTGARSDHFGRIEDPVELLEIPQQARIGVRTVIQGRPSNASRPGWLLPGSESILVHEEVDQVSLTSVERETRIHVLHAIDSRSEPISDESREMNMRYV